jgi:hydroxyquinol 1,2-dioxygenase
MTGSGDARPGVAAPADLTAEAVTRLAATPDPRLREIMRALVRHLHEFAVEVNLTEGELMAGVRFLTETGHKCDDVRQEFILLSDTLGLTSLVDLLTHGSDDPAVTESTVLGPFYVPGAPWREPGESMVTWAGASGQRAVVRGRVLSADGTPLPGAVLDLWQNDASGFYAVQQPGVQPTDNLRGRYTTDDAGRYEVRTIRPVPYAIPDDGPVGRLIAATGRHPWRAAHIHFIVSADGHTPVTTHIFDRDSDYLDSDAVFGVKESLVREFTPQPDNTVLLEHDFTLQPVAPESPVAPDDSREIGAWE